MGARTKWAILAVGCIAVAAASLAVSRTPNFDPWGWIIWGREILHLDLNTSQGPSWKPGPVLFTTAFALFGGIAPVLWMFTARLGALLGVVLAYRIAARFGGRLAGVIAAALLLVMHDYVNGALSGEAEPMMVGFLLAAIEAALLQRRRTALFLLLFASLVRPEVWLILGAYSLYLWLSAPEQRRWIILAWTLLGLLWFGGDWWGSGNPLLSSERAKQFIWLNQWDHYRHPAVAMLNLAGSLLHRPAIILAIFAVIVAAVRRTFVVTALSLGALGMLATVTAMAQEGYPVLDRFLFGSLALVFVLSGIGGGYLVRIAGRRHAVLAAIVGVAIVAILSPLTIDNARALRPVVNRSRDWTAEVTSLPRAIDAAGGRPRIVACHASIATHVLDASALAWYLDVPMTRIFRWPDDPNGFVFIRVGAQLAAVESQRPLRIIPIAQADGWRVLFVVTNWRAPLSC